MGMNAFNCPKCCRVTKHVEISCREFNALEGKETIVQVASTIFDLVGVTRAIGALGGVRFWKCCECGEASPRTIKGEIYYAKK